MAITSKEPQRHTPAGPVPATILDDEQLNAAISTYLPANYNFEIHKTIHHVRHYGSKCVALQMPEGLTLWATSISDIVERFTDATTVIMGDVTYGACCVDDFTARALGADLLVHYGHSCLVPVDQTSIRTLYVFVEIAIDASHVCATIRSNFPSVQSEFRATITDKEQEQSKAKVEIGIEGADGGISAPPRPTHLVLVATVQFINALHNIKDHLEQSESYEDFYDVGRTTEQTGSDPAERRPLTLATSSSSAADGQDKSMTKQTWHSSAYRVTIPQVKPLSQGEILGCTSPKLPSGVEDSVDGIIYLGDGRFHLESIMIANPRLPAFRYDPYEKRFVREGYDHTLMRRNRANAVQEAKGSLDAFSASTTAVQDIEGNGQSVVPSVPPTRGWGLVLGTLGRQGSVRVLSHLRSMLEPRSVPSIPILLSELSPQKLALFGESLAAFVQTSCPRLSIDWGDAFAKPLLSPYEAAVALEKAPGWRSTASKRLPAATATTAPKTPAHVQVELEKGHEGDRAGKANEDDNDDQLGDYPMDYYADGSLGPWTPRHGLGVRKSNAKGISNRELLRRGRGAATAAARRTAAA